MILLTSALLLSAGTGLPSPSPQPSPPPDPCGGTTTALLATLNRPTIGFSPCVVKQGETVIEAGYQNSSDTEGTQTNFPQGDIRVGVARNVELSVLGPNYAWQSAAGVTTQGMLDSSFDAKVEWWHDASSAFATDAIFTFPTGAATFTAGYPTQILDLNFGTAIGPKFGFGTTIGIQSGRVGALLPSIVFTNQFQERAQLYAEAFGSTSINPAGDTLFGVNGGIQYLVTPSLELDAELGNTTTAGAHAHYIGVGLGLKL